MITIKSWIRKRGFDVKVANDEGTYKSRSFAEAQYILRTIARSYALIN